MHSLLLRQIMFCSCYLNKTKQKKRKKKEKQKQKIYIYIFRRKDHCAKSHIMINKVRFNRYKNHNHFLYIVNKRLAFSRN